MPSVKLSIDLDPDDTDDGGAVGSTYEFLYIAADLIFVKGTAVVSGTEPNRSDAHGPFSSTGI